MGNDQLTASDRQIIDAQKVTKSLWATACHEAGHAFAMWNFGFRIRSATIVPDESSLGQVRHSSRLFSENIFEGELSRAALRKAEDRILVCLAGRAAAKVFGRSPNWRQADGDRKYVNDILLGLYNKKTASAAFEFYNLRAIDLVQNVKGRTCIPYLAQRLIERRTISGAKIGEAFREATRLAIANQSSSSPVAMNSLAASKT